MSPSMAPDVGGVCMALLSFKVKGLGGRLDEVKQRLVN